MVLWKQESECNVLCLKILLTSILHIGQDIKPILLVLILYNLMVGQHLVQDVQVKLAVLDIIFRLILIIDIKIKLNLIKNVKRYELISFNFT